MNSVSIDETKVGESFMWYCLSQINEEQLTDYLYQYRDDFREYVLGKLESEIIKSTDDEVVVQHKTLELKKDLDTTMDRVNLNIGNFVDRMGLGVEDWKKILDL